jgi:predicted nucleic acid-binding protein
MTVVGTPKEEAEDYREILIEMAEASGGGTLTPPRTVHDCRDHEDNLVLDLAAEVGALLIVSENAGGDGSPAAPVGRRRAGTR